MIKSIYNVTFNELKSTKHYIYKYEIPKMFLDHFDLETINGVIEWYLTWKKLDKKENQNTCILKDIFKEDYNKVLAIINLYKYLRNIE